MTDVIALVCGGISLAALVIWLVTYWHGLRANARALAEIRRLNAEWRAEVAEWQRTVAEWHALRERSDV